MGSQAAEDGAAAATLPEPGDARALYVVDLSGYLFRAYHALPPLSTSKGEPTHAVHGVAAMLQKLIGAHQPAHLVAAIDAPGRSFRHAIDARYKANRPEAPPDLHTQIARVHEVIDAMQIPRLEREGYEADDVIASLIPYARAHGLRTVIVSADKDLLQVVGQDVVMYDTMRDRVFGETETERYMGVPPHQVRDLLALTGDSSDNIPGVPKVGPKTAVKLLSRWGDADAIYAHLDEVEGASVRTNLRNHEQDARRSRELVTLRADLELDLDPEKLRWSGPDPGKLRQLYTELEFTRLLQQLEPAAAEEGHYDRAATVGSLDRALAEAREAGQVAIHVALDRDDPMYGGLVGVALSWEPGQGVYIPLGHRYLGVPEQPDRDTVLARLRGLLEDEHVWKLSADLKRDTVSLGRFGVELKGKAFDVMLASYLLDAGKHAHGLADVARSELGFEIPSYDQVTDRQRGSQNPLPEVDVERAGDWACRWADGTTRTATVLGSRIESEEFSALLYDLELPLARVLAAMERTGIRLDVERLAEISRDVDTQLTQLERRCTELAGREFNVASPRQLETILFDELQLPVIKRTKTARSTDHEVLEELAAQHPLPAAIVEHRQLAKLKSTYLDALPKQADPETGRIYTRYNQAVAATGRLSSSEPNLQNIPIRSDIGRSIRTAFVPEPGWEILAADYSQIELRVLAHVSEDPELREAFATDSDVHVRTATALFSVTPDGVTREMRAQAKTVNFAVIYGQTHFALARNLGIERSEAKRYIDAFFERYAGVKQYMDDVVEFARQTGEVRTLLGRRRLMPDLHSRNRQLRSGAERIARNTPIQGSAADIMKRAMVRIHDELHRHAMRSRMLLTVHDELVFEVPPEEKEPLAKRVRNAMEHAMELSVPLAVELGWGPSWGEAH